ncbi:MAG: aspartate/glutamate racemase family protein [Phycisphaerae bacterium]|nr:aspartate/glutamate racemase family protein [Phycisphaerae bacterium]
MKTKQRNDAVIGMTAWEAGGENTLSQLETLPGNIVHPATFAFPIRFLRVEGANFRTVVLEPSRAVLGNMIAAVRRLQTEGVRAITTSCGFSAIWQRELADAVDIPVFTSSLLQVPMVKRMLRDDQVVGVITADKQSLTPQHLSAVGIDDLSILRVADVADTPQFAAVRDDPEAILDPAAFVREIVEVAETLRRENPNVGAFVLECTDLPPASRAIRDKTHLPVFDIVTLVNFVHQAVG